MVSSSIPEQIERLRESQCQALLCEEGFDDLSAVSVTSISTVNPFQPQDDYASHPPRMLGHEASVFQGTERVEDSASCLTAPSVTPPLVVRVDVQQRSLLFHHPPTPRERSLMSLISIHGYFCWTLPLAQRIMAMVPTVNFVRNTLRISFRTTSVAAAHRSNPDDLEVMGQEVANEVVADAALHWLDTASRRGYHMTPGKWQQIEQITLHDCEQHKDNSNCEMSEVDAVAPQALFLTRRESGGSTRSNYSTASLASRKRSLSRRDNLEAQLEQVQKRVKRNHEYDVRRGKGQGVKNINAKFYTPLIRERCFEYSSINTGNKSRNDDLKQSVAMEILIQLGEHGGRVLDEDNVTVLDNPRAVKKVMNALKDKAREMRKRGGNETSDPKEASAPDAAVPDPSSRRSSASIPVFVAGTKPMPQEVIEIEPEAFVEGGVTPEEGEALESFSSYWLRKRG